MSTHLIFHTRKNLASLIIVFMAVSVFAQNPTFEWAVNMGGSDQLNGSDMVVDREGNVYTTGYIRGTIDLDPGDEVFELTSSGDRDMFIQKLDPNGNFLWAGRIGGNGLDWGAGIVLDNDGNIYVTGFFEGNIDLNPTSGFTSANSEGGIDSFIIKLGTNGNFIWGKSLGGSNSDYGLDVTFDKLNNVYVSGYFSRTVDFDPGDEVFEMTSNGQIDIYILKLDQDGEFNWAKQFGGPQSDRGISVDVDTSGNVFLAGVFNMDVDFDPSENEFLLTSQGSEDIFVLRLDEEGALVWAKSFGGDMQDWCSSMKCDNYGNIYLTGYFNSEVNFDEEGNDGFMSSNGDDDVYVLKLSIEGKFQWVKQLAGESGENGRALAVDIFGNVTVAGHFESTVDFDPGPDEYFLSSNGERDIFVTKLNIDGDFLWTSQIGGAEDDLCFGLTSDMIGATFLTGSFRGAVDFNPGTETEILSSVGVQDLYVLKLVDELVLADEELIENPIMIYPNPTTGLVNVDVEESVSNLEIEVFDINGQFQHSHKLSNTASIFIDIEGTPGMYLLNIKSDNSTKTVRVIKR